MKDLPPSAAFLSQLFQEADQLVKALAKSRGESPEWTEAEMLCAVSMVLPAARLSCVCASVLSADPALNTPSTVSVEHVAVRLGEQLFILSGAISETAWKDRVCEDLRALMERSSTGRQGPIRVEVDPPLALGVDREDPRVLEALELLVPKFRALQAHFHLDAHTPEVLPLPSRRL